MRQQQDWKVADFERSARAGTRKSGTAAGSGRQLPIDGALCGTVPPLRWDKSVSALRRVQTLSVAPPTAPFPSPSLRVLKQPPVHLSAALYTSYYRWMLWLPLFEKWQLLMWISAEERGRKLDWLLKNVERCLQKFNERSQGIWWLFFLYHLSLNQLKCCTKKCVERIDPTISFLSAQFEHIFRQSCIQLFTCDIGVSGNCDMSGSKWFTDRSCRIGLCKAFSTYLSSVCLHSSDSSPLLLHWFTTSYST